MRTKNAFRNLVVSLAYEVFIFTLGLIVPRFIILSYGDSINGLTQTINRLLTIVNLLQAGAVGASIFQMFKPVAEEDYETQSAIMYSSKRFFNRMGCIYLAIVLAVSVVYGYILQSSEITMAEIMLSFAVLAVNGALYFFFTARHDIVFSSYQKKYLLSVTSFIEKTVYYILLFVVVNGKMYFIYMYVALLLSGFVRVSVNSYFYWRLTRNKLTNRPQNRNMHIKDRKYLMLSSVSEQLMTSAPTVIITSIVGLAYSSVFSIYSMVYLSLKTIVNSLHLAVSAIFGNLVASANDERVSNVFNILLYMFTILGALLASCAAYLLIPFVGLYTDGFTGVNYSYPVLALFVVCYVALFALKTVYSFVANVYGLFKQTCRPNLICTSVGVGVSIVCTYLYGMPYVMVGVLLYDISTTIVLITVFKREIPWFNLKKMPLRVGVLFVLPILSFVQFLLRPKLLMSGWIGWTMTGVVCALINAAILLVYTVIFERRELISLVQYLQVIFRKKDTKSEEEIR